MEYRLIFLSIFLNLFFPEFSFVQQWNFDNSAIDLLSKSSFISIKVLEDTKYNIYVRLYKNLSIEDNEVVYKKYLTVYYDNSLIYGGEVDFDKIESFHRFRHDIIICPKGKYHPIYFYSNTYSTLNLGLLRGNRDWELKCEIHEQGYFFIFYLMNGQSHFFYINPQESVWNQMITHQEIYGLKCGIKISDNYEYSWAYLVKSENKIKLIGSKYTIKSDIISRNDNGGIVDIMIAGKYTRGCFENNNDHFYFLTYTNTSDFSCGYFDTTNFIDYQNVRQYSVIKNEESPLEFADDVEIEYIKFINNYKYAYYKIKNIINDKYYYGIIDIKKNIVVFNTEKEIITYVSYTDISMLAITSTTAYEICVIKKDGVCIDSYDCTDTNYNYIADL